MERLVCGLGAVAEDTAAHKRNDENKKGNDMEPFNLERALAGDPVVTRDGRPVAQFAIFKAKGRDTLYGVLDEYVSSWTPEGCWSVDGEELPNDLFMAPAKREGWIIVRSPDENGIRKTSDMYPSPDVLYTHNPELIHCWIRKVEWEE